MRQPERVHGLLAAELRAAPPRASAELRERVQAIASSVPPPREPRLWGRWTRRSALVLVPAAVGAVAIGIGVVASNRGGGNEATGPGAAVHGAKSPGPQDTPSRPKVPANGAYEAAAPTAGADALRSLRQAPPPNGRRLQDYRATLRVRVSSFDDLSPATTRAMGIVRSLGGYVVRADYGAAGGTEGEGDSLLVVRVPVGKVSAAVLRFSQLGDVVAQQVSISDLQSTFNAQTDRIRSLRGTIATLERELRRTDLTTEQRNRLQLQLARARDQLDAALGARDATLRRGRLAQVSLTLTTREGAEPVAPSKPGRFERTLRDALGVLAAMATWLLAALIVAGPFVLLALAAVALERRRRRRADQRLLEQTG
jgi:hypothetical protein